MKKVYACVGRENPLKEVQRTKSFAGVWGVPKNSFIFICRRRRREKKDKRKYEKLIA